MKFFSYICKCVALDTGMCAHVVTREDLHISERFGYFVV